MKALIACLLVVLSLGVGCSRRQTQDSIVGIWSEAGTATLLEIKPGGVVKIIGGIQTNTGTYSFEPPSTLTVRFDGNTSKPGPHQAVCSLNGDQMELQWEYGETNQYQRIKK
jgi:hypothetical protein